MSRFHLKFFVRKVLSALMPNHQAVHQLRHTAIGNHRESMRLSLNRFTKPHEESCLTYSHDYYYHHYSIYLATFSNTDLLLQLFLQVHDIFCNADHPSAQTASTSELASCSAMFISISPKELSWKTSINPFVVREST